MNPILFPQDGLRILDQRLVEQLPLSPLSLRRNRSCAPFWYITTHASYVYEVSWAALASFPMTC